MTSLRELAYSRLSPRLSPLAAAAMLGPRGPGGCEASSTAALYKSSTQQNKPRPRNPTGRNRCVWFSFFVKTLCFLYLKATFIKCNDHDGSDPEQRESTKFSSFKKLQSESQKVKSFTSGDLKSASCDEVNKCTQTNDESYNFLLFSYTKVHFVNAFWF